MVRNLSCASSARTLFVCFSRYTLVYECIHTRIQTYFLRTRHECIFFITGSLQSDRGHPQSDEHVQEDACSQDHGQLLWETGAGLLEGWPLPVPCRCVTQALPAVQRDEEEYYSGGVAEVSFTFSIRKKKAGSKICIFFFTVYYELFL